MNLGQFLQNSPLQLLGYPIWRLREIAYDAWLNYGLSRLPPAIALICVNHKLIQDDKVYCGTDLRRAFYFSGSHLHWVYEPPTAAERTQYFCAMRSITGGSPYPACEHPLESQPLQVSRTRMGSWPNGKGAFPAPKEPLCAS